MNGISSGWDADRAAGRCRPPQKTRAARSTNTSLAAAASSTSNATPRMPLRVGTDRQSCGNIQHDPRQFGSDDAQNLALCLAVGESGAMDAHECRGVRNADSASECLRTRYRPASRVRPGCAGRRSEPSGSSPRPGRHCVGVRLKPGGGRQHRWRASQASNGYRCEAAIATGPEFTGLMAHLTQTPHGWCSLLRAGAPPVRRCQHRASAQGPGPGADDRRASLVPVAGQSTGRRCA